MRRYITRGQKHHLNAQIGEIYILETTGAFLIEQGLFHVIKYVKTTRNNYFSVQELNL